jgi:hypothetical protein
MDASECYAAGVKDKGTHGTATVASFGQRGGFDYVCATGSSAAAGRIRWYGWVGDLSVAIDEVRKLMR